MSASIRLDDVYVRFPAGRDWLGRINQHAHALNGVSLSVTKGRTLGVLGESGCGKSTLAQVLTGLTVPSSGQMTVPERSQKISIVLQDPNSSLDPRMAIWRIITEPVFLHQAQDRKALRALAAGLLQRVGLRAEHADRFPHELSGGQRQRVAIARALSNNPDIVVLDEPTSALDVSVQGQILNLLLELQAEHGLGYVFISHNVSVIKHFCDDVAVMYLGQIVEQGPASIVLEKPKHPYTDILLSAVPKIGKGRASSKLDETELPSNRKLPQGCFFLSRCPMAAQGCDQPQNLRALSKHHDVRCHRAMAKGPK